MALGHILESSQGYIEHPPAGTNFGAADQPIDSGFAMIIDSNISWLVEQNTRCLVSTIMGGYGQANISMDAATDAFRYGFRDGLTDNALIGGPAVPTSASCVAATEPNHIAWSRFVSTRFGPFLGIADRKLATDGSTRTLRSHDIGVSVSHQGDIDYGKVYYYVTADGAPPYNNSSILGSTSFQPSLNDGVAKNTCHYSTTLQFTTPIDNTRETSYPWIYSLSPGVMSARFLSFYIWVGYHGTEGHQNDQIVSLSVNEYRD